MNNLSEKINKTVKVFTAHYKEIPLEVFTYPYEVLVSTVLSARTRDEVTLLAANRLFEIAPNINALNQINVAEIQKRIFPVGFYKIKAKHLKLLSDKILKEFEGVIPQTRKELMALPGVGRKTANLVLNRAFKKPAIAVDTHVHKISNLLGWVETKSPKETEEKLTKIIPEKYWSEINRLFVSIGRQYYSKRELSNFLKKEKLI
jgi:endonuclease III